MARGRLISKSLGSSRKFHALLAAGGKLGEFCQVLYPLIVANTDDFGRMPGDAFTVKNVVLPSSRRPERDFDTALDVLHTVGIIVRYVVDGSEYLQVVDFDTHQMNLHKRSNSRFPEPPGNSGNSGNFRESPSEFKRTEQKGTEDKGTEPRTAHTRKADVLFEKFWTAYPRKKAKEDARRAWDKRRPDDALTEAIVKAVQVQAQSPDWQKDDGKFIPYPATWLNRAQWTDVVDFQPSPPSHVDPLAWMDECRALHNRDCGSAWRHDQRMKLDAMKAGAA